MKIEIREIDGSEPKITGTILTEGRAASGGRAEVFAPGSVTWPGEGIGIAPGHDEDTEIHVHPIRQKSGELTFEARATDALKQAYKAGAKFMSVEFHALKERRTAGGVREVLKAIVLRAALVPTPEYDTTAAEVRQRSRRRMA